MRGLAYILFLCMLLSVSAFGQNKVTAYYDSDQKLVKETFFVSDTISMALEGGYKAYYASGSLKEQGQFKNNQATGFWEYFYESGKPKMRGELKNGSNYGHWQYFYENGNLSMEGPIYDGQRQDEWVHYYENGSIKRKGKYRNNKKVGVWNYFYENHEGVQGPLKAQAVYNEDGVGDYKEFYPNGSLKAEGKYIDGVSEGQWTFYYPDGTVEAQGKYANGVRTGNWTFYHSNKKVASEGIYEEGLRAGNWKFYHSNGLLSSEGKMENDKKDGYWKLYDRWGEFKGEGNFLKGEGEYKEFHENGKLKVLGYIKNDKNEGEWLYYYEDGRLEGRANFIKGKGYYTGYYHDGTVNMEGEVEDGRRIGIWKMYEKNGTLSGYYKIYYEDEEPVYKIVEEKDPVFVRVDYSKPEYRYKVRRFRNFIPRVNEFKALILATNPLASLAGSVPFSMEYYVQERLGYDLQMTYIRDPFFKNHAKPDLNKEYTQGFSFALKQKFYQMEDKLGMLYYGHEVRVSSITHSMNKLIAVDEVQTVSEFKADELSAEYSIIFGNRFTKDAGNKGWTVDVFVGLGVGYRSVNRNFNTFEVDSPVLKNLHSGITVPVRVGFNIGYALNRLKRN